MRWCAFVYSWGCWTLLDQPGCVSEHILVRGEDWVGETDEKNLMGPSPTDNGEENRESAGGLRRDEDRLVKTSTARHDWVIGGRGIQRRYIRREVYQRKDDEWTGLGLYRARHNSLARLMSDTSPVTPRVRLTLTSANQPRPLTQNSISLASVTTSEPLSPHLRGFQATTAPSIGIGAPLLSLAPVSSARVRTRKRNPVLAWARPLPG